jgi:hypothetical protein
MDGDGDGVGNTHDHGMSKMLVDETDFMAQERMEISTIQKLPLKRRKFGFRDDSLFPRYPFRSTEARRQRNLARWLRIYPAIPPKVVGLQFPLDSVGSVGLDVSVFDGTTSQEVDKPLSVDAVSIISISSVEVQNQGEIQATTNESPVSGTATSRVTTPEPISVKPSSTESVSDIFVPVTHEAATNISEDIEALAANSLRYREYVAERSRTAKIRMRGQWQTLSSLFQTNEQTSTSTDNRFLSVMELLRMCKETFVFNIVLYLRALAVQWNLHEVARYYFDPFFFSLN